MTSDTAPAIAHRDAGTGPIAIVLPREDQPAAAQVARDTEQAVLAAAGSRPVFTVIVDGPEAASAAPDLTQPRHVLTATTSSWGGLVAHGFRHALALGAHAIVIADPEMTAIQEPLTAAVRQLREQVGVVCSPLAQPWWRQLLAIHVLRPLLGAALGVAMVDPQARTLVVSARVAQAALQPRWELEEVDWPAQHGLGVLGAACYTGQRVIETPARTPLEDPHYTAALFDRDLVEELLYAALPLCRQNPPAHRPVAAWVPDLDGHRPAPAQRLLDGRDALHCAQRSPILRRRDTDPWPQPLITAWRGVRAGCGLYPLVHDLLDAYEDRLLAWLPLIVESYSRQARASATEAAAEFLRVTGTAVAVPADAELAPP